MTAELDLCRTCLETTLLVFPGSDSFILLIDMNEELRQKVNAIKVEQTEQEHEIVKIQKRLLDII